MAIYKLDKAGIQRLQETSFEQEKILEREDLQRILRDDIEVICPDVLVIAEEFCQWEDSRRRLDLLGLDKKANLVVIELKRDESGEHMDLQAIRYAAMVSTMTFDQVVDVYGEYLQKRQLEGDAKEKILNFMGWTEEAEDQFAQNVLIVLVSADFSKELTTAVLWLNQRDLDIRCVRLKPYKQDGKVFLDVQQVIPLPEASEYQIQVKHKEHMERATKTKTWDEPSFEKALHENKGMDYVKVAHDILEWSKSWANRICWGSGARSGSYIPVRDCEETEYFFFTVWTYGTIEIQFQWLLYRGPFKEVNMRTELLNRLNRIPDVELPADSIDRRPGIDLKLLSNPESMQMFHDCIQWALQVVKDSD